MRQAHGRRPFAARADEPDDRRAHREQRGARGAWPHEDPGHVLVERANDPARRRSLSAGCRTGPSCAFSAVIVAGRELEPQRATIERTFGARTVEDAPPRPHRSVGV